MKAMVVLTEQDSLELRELPTPIPGPGEVLVAVRAAGINRADLLQRRGKYTQSSLARPGDLVAGMEVAGELAALGAGVSGHSVGDRVMAMCGGAYSELTVIDHRLLLPVPHHLSWTEAASLPVGLMTAYDALMNAARLRPGESVLVSAAGSVVGQLVVQLARAAGASTVIGTSRAARRRQQVASLGAHHVLDGTAADFVHQLHSITAGRGVDVIIDHVGADAFAEHLGALAVEGRLISVGRLGGGATQLDLNALALRRLTLSGVTFRTRLIDDYAAIAAGVRMHALPQVANGTVQPARTEQFSLEEAVDAQEFMRANKHKGKVVLVISAR